MTGEQFKRHLRQIEHDFERFVKDDIQDIVGTEAVNHFKQSFVDGGFTDKVLDKWAPRKHKYGNDTKDGKEVLTQSGDLGESIYYTKLANGNVEISSDRKYAKIHNEGGTIEIPVTEALQRWAWAMWYESNKTNGLYKALALTKASKIVVTIPARPFIGDSEVLRENTNEKIGRELRKIFKA